MSEHGRTVLGNVFIEQDASLDTPQQACQRGLAVEEWEISQILAVVLEDRLMRSFPRRRSSKRDKPSGPTTTASPSIVKLLALIRSAATAIADSLAVQLFPLRV
jgi:hypothetical protein